MVAKTLSGSSTLESREGSQPLVVTQSHLQRTVPTPSPSKGPSPQPPTQSADPASTLDSDQNKKKKKFFFSPSEGFYPQRSCHYRELSVQTCTPTGAQRHLLIGEALLLAYFHSIPG